MNVKHNADIFWVKLLKRKYSDTAKKFLITIPMTCLATVNTEKVFLCGKTEQEAQRWAVFWRVISH